MSFLTINKSLIPRICNLSRNYCFKSDISLDKLYSTSKLKIFTPPPPPAKKDDKFNGFIPMNKLDVTYSRSSGPGGQNVNCVSTKVDVRFKVETADWIPEVARKKIAEDLTSLTKDGFLVIRSDKTRSQQMNLADALEKIRNIIRDCEKPELVSSPESVERARKQHEKSARLRLQMKRERSSVKSNRQNPDF